MSTTVLLNITRFLVLLFAQVLVFNNINILGYINPYPYILFILLFPINGNKFLLLLSSFLLGLLIDMFSNSAGIHAFASTFLAYIRPNLFRFSFGFSYQHQTIKLSDKLSTERITLLIIAIVLHHFLLFGLEYFRISLFVEIITKTLLTSLATFLVSLLIIFLIKSSKR
ncbi:rod shape-determining protein MreD [Flavobacterium sp.]|uniref:rod shape-determining protein MreD n=1 Tax=Flavobacterium sp. TaxID=239 RepID=UPI003526C6AA